ncbi:hypothetical protein F5Y04DRAFT_293078 [Hypomontagnella monticulosa]|nr:hypothetical protein F5Y04DRAFT_293078 [Hypomontagnella monticulosa]
MYSHRHIQQWQQPPPVVGTPPAYPQQPVLPAQDLYSPVQDGFQPGLPQAQPQMQPQVQYQMQHQMQQQVLAQSFPAYPMWPTYDPTHRAANYIQPGPLEMQMGQMPQPLVAQGPPIASNADFTRLEIMLETYLQANTARVPPRDFLEDMMAGVGVRPSRNTPEYLLYRKRKLDYWFTFNRFIALRQLQDHSEVLKLVAVVRMLAEHKMLGRTFLLEAYNFAIDYYGRFQSSGIETRRLYGWALQLQEGGLMKSEDNIPEDQMEFYVVYGVPLCHLPCD